MSADVTYPLAFFAGILSFLSPCVFPLLPSYVSFITGLSFEKLTADSKEERAKIKRLTVSNSLFFILGLSVIYVALGASSSLIGKFFREYQETIRIAGGVLTIIFGLFIAGILKLDFLMRERKFHMHGRPTGYLGAFLIGMTFAAGWTPCIGPILGSILSISASSGQASFGFKLLSVYSLGFALPFLISALAINSFLLYSRRLMKYIKLIMLLGGLVLIAFGVLLLTDNVKILSGLMPDIGVEKILRK